MKCLVVIAHPLADSLCHELARTAVATLTAAGHEVEVEDLCASGFPPALTAAERRSYYGPSFDASALLGTCAPACRFEMLSLYKAERLTEARVAVFRARIERSLSRWA